MEARNFRYIRFGYLLYVDEKDDDFLADIFEGRMHLTTEQEEGLYSRYWGKLMAVVESAKPVVPIILTNIKTSCTILFQTERHRHIGNASHKSK